MTFNIAGPLGCREIAPLEQPYGFVLDGHGGHTETVFCRYCGRRAPAPWEVSHPPNCEIRLDPRFPPTEDTVQDPSAVIDAMAHPAGETVTTVDVENLGD